MRTKANFILLGILIAAVVNGVAQPSITNQPQSQTNVAGAMVAFSVAALGTPPLVFQWRAYTGGTAFTNIPGGTTATLLLTNVQPTAVRFGAVVSNTDGSVTSLLARLTVVTPLPESASVNFEGKQTSPVRLSPDGSRLFAVNTPDARLSVFDLADPSNPILMAEIPVGIEPVSVNPLSDDEAWVVNEVSDSVSIVSVARRLVTDTLHVKDEPADVAFAGGRAFVTAARRNEVRVFDITNHSEIATIPLFGENPRALAVSPDGSKVYATFALSGNRTTIVPAASAPPQPMPLNITNAPPQVGLIVDATDTNWSHVVQFTMPDNDVAELDAASLSVVRYFSRVGTVNLGLAVQPWSGDLFVANTDARNLVHFEPGVRGHSVDNRITRVEIANGAVTPFNLNPGVNYNTLPNLAVKATALAQPTAIVFDPSGTFMYVAAFGTDRIARVDTNGNVLARIEIGPATGSTTDPRTKRGPRGLTLNANAQRLYVLNRIANTISVVDTTTDTVVRELPVGSFDPTPAVVRSGRGFLYDAKLSGNGTVSCAACHVDAEMDLLAWDLGDPSGAMEPVTVLIDTLGGSYFTNSTRHPMKGPMTTQTLRGLKGLEPLHWRGDRTNFLHFNGAFSALFGGSILTNSDMAAYRAFIETIAFQPNPNQNLDRNLPSVFAGGDPIAGRNTFQSEVYNPATGLRCVDCHVGIPGTDKFIADDAGLGLSQHFKVPHLRNLYQKLHFTNAPGASSIGGFGFSHDGSDATLAKNLSAERFPNFRNDAVRKRNLSAFLQCFDTGTAPAVGYTRTLTAATVDTSVATNDWNVLESQAALLTSINLVVKGTIDGTNRGLLYDPAARNYRSDRTGTGPFTRAQLRTKVLADDTLTLMGVPPGLGTRMGIDRNLDGILDGDVGVPLLQIVRSGMNAVVSWPTYPNSFLLEASATLAPGSWHAESGFRTVVGNDFNVTNALSLSKRFFRLKRL